MSYWNSIDGNTFDRAAVTALLKQPGFQLTMSHRQDRTWGANVASHATRENVKIRPNLARAILRGKHMRFVERVSASFGPGTSRCYMLRYEWTEAKLDPTNVAAEMLGMLKGLNQNEYE